MEGTRRFTKICANSRLAFHVIDSERKANYLKLDELESLLNYSKRFSNLKTIVTISVRHINSTRRLDAIVRLAQKHENLGINLVAGNKAYLTFREQRRPAIKLLKGFTKYLRSRLPDTIIFVGAEGLVKTSATLASSYGAIPFLLMDKGLEENVDQIRKAAGECLIALYVPYLISSNPSMVSNAFLEELSPYSLRRKWVREEVKRLGYNPDHVDNFIERTSGGKSPQIMPEDLKVVFTMAARSLSICGGEEDVTNRLRELYNKDISIVIGLPLKEGRSQIQALGRCVERISGRSSTWKT